MKSWPTSRGAREISTSSMPGARGGYAEQFNRSLAIPPFEGGELLQFSFNEAIVG